MNHPRPRWSPAEDAQDESVTPAFSCDTYGLSPRRGIVHGWGRSRMYVQRWGPGKRVGLSVRLKVGITSLFLHAIHVGR